MDTSSNSDDDLKVDAEANVPEEEEPDIMEVESRLTSTWCNRRSMCKKAKNTSYAS